MKIAYLHGLESTIDKKDPKIIFMHERFGEVYAPSINYKDPSTFNKLLNEIKRLKPNLIVGSSMGGYVSYLIGSKLSIPTLLFNPAVVGRSFDPVVDTTGLKGTSNTVYFGKNDKVISGTDVRAYFNEMDVGSFSYNYYNGEHRVPADVFISAIKNILQIKENKLNKMKHTKQFEEFINELAINEASVVQLEELTSAQQKQIKQFETIIGGKCETIWDGIHGFIVAIKLQNQSGSYRFDVDTMKKLIQAKVRWVEEDLGGRVNIGF